MQPALLVRLQPNGPWRYGPGEGGQQRTDALYRSDRLYSALTLALGELGFLEEWLAATARAAQPAVAFSSLFPYQGDTLFVVPPAALWPPPPNLVTSSTPVFLSKIRWDAVQFVPLPLIESLATGQSILADQWLPDTESGCLLRRDRPSASPFRTVLRTAAAVDRLTRSAVHVESFACVEFESSSGLWCAARYRDRDAQSTWGNRVEAAFRLLADSGFGGRRSSGWGRSEPPVFQNGAWPALLMPKLDRRARNASEGASNGEKSSFWLLSLCSPAPSDSIDWRAGDYRLLIRGGRIANHSASGSLKRSVRMIAEGSVLVASREPAGAAVDVAPEGLPHPAYRSGLALAIKLPSPGAVSDLQPIEIPSDEEAPEPRPCPEPQTESVAEPEPEARSAQPEAGTAEPEPEPSAEPPQQPQPQEPSDEI